MPGQEIQLSGEHVAERRSIINVEVPVRHDLNIAARRPPYMVQGRLNGDQPATLAQNEQGRAAYIRCRQSRPIPDDGKQDTRRNLGLALNTLGDHGVEVGLIRQHQRLTAAWPADVDENRRRAASARDHIAYRRPEKSEAANRIRQTR